GIAHAVARGRHAVVVAAHGDHRSLGAGAPAVDLPATVPRGTHGVVRARIRRVHGHPSVGTGRGNVHVHVRGVVVVVRLGDPVGGVDRHVEPVVPGGNVGDVHVLAVERPGVQVVPAGVDALIRAGVQLVEGDVVAHAHEATRVHQTEGLLVAHGNLVPGGIQQGVVGIAAKVPVTMAHTVLETAVGPV